MCTLKVDRIQYRTHSMGKRSPSILMASVIVILRFD